MVYCSAFTPKVYYNVPFKPSFLNSPTFIHSGQEGDEFYKSIPFPTGSKNGHAICTRVLFLVRLLKDYRGKLRAQVPTSQFKNLPHNILSILEQSNVPLDKKYVAFPRLFQALQGNQLDPLLHCHHKNEDTLDDRFFNLELLDRDSHVYLHTHGYQFTPDEDYFQPQDDYFYYYLESPYLSDLGLDKQSLINGLYAPFTYQHFLTLYKVPSYLSHLSSAGSVPYPIEGLDCNLDAQVKVSTLPPSPPKVSVLPDRDFFDYAEYGDLKSNMGFASVEDRLVWEQYTIERLRTKLRGECRPSTAKLNITDQS